MFSSATRMSDFGDITEEATSSREAVVITKALPQLITAVYKKFDTYQMTNYIDLFLYFQ